MISVELTLLADSNVDSDRLERGFRQSRSLWISMGELGVKMWVTRRIFPHICGKVCDKCVKVRILWTELSTLSTGRAVDKCVLSARRLCKSRSITQPIQISQPIQSEFAASISHPRFHPPLAEMRDRVRSSSNLHAVRNFTRRPQYIDTTRIAPR